MQRNGIAPFRLKVRDLMNGGGLFDLNIAGPIIG
jgi:hypothetical protein